jgi:hypothetical protein
MTTQERTGWRDQALSERHREWGINCPAVDLDFLMVEYDYGKPAGIIEYKNFRARPVSRVHPTIRALSYLATRAEIPFFVVRYMGPKDCSNWKFDISPINRIAESACATHLNSETGSSGYLIEAEFVSFLYAIRGRGFQLPEEVAFHLLNSKI